MKNDGLLFSSGLKQSKLKVIWSGGGGVFHRARALETPTLN